MVVDVGGRQNYGPFWVPYYNTVPERDHNFDNHHVGFWGLPRICGRGFGFKFQGPGARVRKWSLGAVVDCFEW